MLLESQSLFFVVAVVAVLALRWYFTRADMPKIKNIPEVPGVPIFGSLLQLGDSHTQKAKQWAKEYGAVFQTRLGNRRIVFVNTYDSIKHFWISNQSAMMSRPLFHTFHSALSGDDGYTIGTSPWSESCKQRRKAAAIAMNRPAVQSYMPIIDLESTGSIKEMLQDIQAGDGDINPDGYFQRFALNSSLTLNYGIRIDAKKDNALLKEIVDVEREISLARSNSNNWQDYVPLLRLWPGKAQESQKVQARRVKYMNYFLNELKARIANGTDKPCITGNVLKDPEARLNDAEIFSICGSMVAGGLDTLPSTIIMTMGFLSSSPGQEIQKRALEDIMRTYPDGDAWERCLLEEKVPYITALTKEALRYWTVFPMALPRRSTKDIEYQGATFPAGTTYFMNALAANYDETRYKNPYEFLPERHLDVSDGAGLPHYAFGAGSRMCVGWQLSNRELYTIFLRLICAFEMVLARDITDAPILDAIGCNAVQSGLSIKPKEFKIKLRARDGAALGEWIKGGEERTKDLW